MYLDTKAKILIIVIVLFVIFFFIIPAGSTSSTGTSNCDVLEHATNLDEMSGNFSNEALQAIASVYNAESGGFDNLQISDQLTAKGLTSSVVTAPTVSLTTLTSTGAGIDTAKPLNIKAGINVVDKLCAGTVCISAAGLVDMINDYNSTNRLYSNRPSDYILYDDIFDAFNDGILTKYGNPAGYNDSGYRYGNWNGRTMINIGKVNDGSGGWNVKIPAGMTVIWIRCLNDRRCIVGVKGLRVHGSGYRYAKTLTPWGDFLEGTFLKGPNNFHKWFPIALPKDAGGKTYQLYGTTANGHNDPYISGIAFSTNPRNHAVFAATTFEQIENPGSDKLPWGSGPGNDPTVYVDKGKTQTIKVPVVNSGVDKLLYFLIGYDNANRYAAGTTIKLSVGSTQLASLKLNYNNAFSKNISGGANAMYAATLLPKALVTTDTMISVVINNGGGPDRAYFHEVGTHDYDA